MTASDSTIDVAAIIESRALGRAAVRLALACWLVTFFDGYDMNVIGFAAPYFAPAYHLDKLMLGHIFSSALAGTLLGGFLFGSLGDRIGRRAAIIAATAIFGALTLALSLASGYWSFIALRFAAGLALGGAIPLTWALGTEYVATRYRATMVTLIMLGYGLGVSAAGPISVALIPRLGWLAVFTFGGAASLVAAMLLVAVLPESLRFLAASGRRADLLARAVRALAPEREIPARARFVLSDEAQEEARSGPGERDAAARLDRDAASPHGAWWSKAAHYLAPLFRGDLRWITPLLWAGYIVSSMTTFFLTSWGPIVYEGLGFTRSSAAWVTSGNSFAGMLGGLALMRFTDRLGVASLAVLALTAVPLLLVAGFAHMGEAAFIALILLLSVFLSGSHFGITSITGIFYPTPHRGLGTGWASSIAKIGSIAGPWIGGIVLSSRLPLQQTFAVMAICPAALGTCMLAIGTLQRRAQRSAVAAPRRPHPSAAGQGL